MGRRASSLKVSVKLFRRAQVLTHLRVDEALLGLLEAEEIVVGHRGTYTREEVERIRVAAELDSLGVNPAGIDVFLRMRDRWRRERNELIDLVEALQGSMKPR